jgi:phosphoesterase RecJ-like protein
MSNDQLSEVRNRISAADTILLAAHLKPDGDAIGSTLALAEFLRTQNKTVSVILPDGIPELYQLYPAEYLTALPENAASYDLAILLDTAVPARAGFTANGYVPEILQDKVQIIDHHPDNPAFGRWNYLDKRAATAEIVFELCESFQKPLPLKCVEFCLMGLLTDTGGLRFDNTDPAALRSAARMLEANASLNKVVNQIYFNKPYNQQLFESELLEKYVRWGCNNRAAWACVEPELLEKYNFDLRNAEGVIDILRSIAGTEIVAIISRRSGRSCRISMRSKNPLRPVIDLAHKYNGGGHAMAAGMSVDFDTLAEASDFFAREVKMLFTDEELKEV